MPVTEKLPVAASALPLSSVSKTTVFSESNPVLPYFFHLKSFAWKGPLTVKVRKKIDQILGYISFCIEIRSHLGHLFGYLYFSVPGPLLGPRPWPPICIYRLNPACVCTYRPCLPNLYLLALVYDLYTHRVLSWFTNNDAE